MGSGFAILLAWLAVAVPPSFAAWQARDDLVSELVARGLLPTNPDGFAPGTPTRKRIGAYVSAARLPPDLNVAVRRRDRQLQISEIVERSRDPLVGELHRRSRRWFAICALCWVLGPVVAAILVPVLGPVIADGIPFAGDAATALALLACWGVLFAFRRRFSGSTVGSDSRS